MLIFVDIFAVVCPVSTPSGSVILKKGEQPVRRYKFGLIVKEEGIIAEPAIPSPPIFQKNAMFNDFLLTKCKSSKVSKILTLYCSNQLRKSDDGRTNIPKNDAQSKTRADAISHRSIQKMNQNDTKRLICTEHLI
jgi:hypothetical protein